MSPIARSNARRVVLLVFALAAIAAAAVTSRPWFLVLAMLLMFPLATSLSQAGRLAVSLQEFRGRSVSAAAWGAPIRAAGDDALRVDSVGAAGAGLLIYLTDSAGRPTLLKVAQPRSWTLEDDRLVIGQAAYVQWADKKLPRADGFPAVEIRRNS